MSEEEYDMFWKSVQCTVEKDVVRTDRSHPYFKGEGNPNIEILKYVCLESNLEMQRNNVLHTIESIRTLTISVCDA